MGEREDADEMEPQQNLTRMETMMITNAKAKTLSMRGEPKIAVNKSVSLYVSDGPLKGTSFPIRKPQVLIGRSDADIVVKDARVSRNHCAVEMHGSTALLVDLESANGTYVDEKKITSCELHHMSEFRVGETTLMLLVTERM